VTLKGDFSFDAISPNGDWLYLIHYTSPQDPTRYLVQAYDLRRWRLASAPIVDPTAPHERMRGNPLTRAMSADGRWAYTLYDGGGHTVRARARHRRTIRALHRPRRRCRLTACRKLRRGSRRRQAARDRGGPKGTINVDPRTLASAVVVACSTRSSECGSCSSLDVVSNPRQLDPRLDPSAGEETSDPGHSVLEPLGERQNSPDPCGDPSFW
jgi:hypothetical protein